MFRFFGTFLEGPYAGRTFQEIVEEDRRKQRSIVILLLRCMVVSLVLSRLTFRMFRYFSLNLFLLFVGLILIQIVYVFFRICSGVRYWQVNFRKEFMQVLLLWVGYLLLTWIISIVQDILMEMSLSHAIVGALEVHTDHLLLYLLFVFLFSLFSTCLIALHVKAILLHIEERTSTSLEG